MYRIGNPFWRVIGSLGVPLTLRVDVLHDKEVGVFVATSPDLRGLVCEAATLEELVQEITDSIDDLVELQLHGRAVPRPVADLRLVTE